MQQDWPSTKGTLGHRQKGLPQPWSVLCGLNHRKLAREMHSRVSLRALTRPSHDGKVIQSENTWPGGVTQWSDCLACAVSWVKLQHNVNCPRLPLPERWGGRESGSLQPSSITLHGLDQAQPGLCKTLSQHTTTLEVA